VLFHRVELYFIASRELEEEGRGGRKEEKEEEVKYDEQIPRVIIAVRDTHKHTHRERVTPFI